MCIHPNVYDVPNEVASYNLQKNMKRKEPEAWVWLIHRSKLFHFLKHYFTSSVLLHSSFATQRKCLAIYKKLMRHTVCTRNRILSQAAWEFLVGKQQLSEFKTNKSH